ncbi:ATP-binding protein [Pseudomonas alabamensis]|uniref:ATP-binding protein n=1 Tax=Pseudomonas alabamensis TaxID=3064349 RepID=UPI0021D8E713|nr:ATP-binding protein [Pseudomonas entomophila]
MALRYLPTPFSLGTPGPDWAIAKNFTWTGSKMRLKRFGTTYIEDPQDNYEIRFSSHEQSYRNYFSILIGSNGTQKSRTLRSILDNAAYMIEAKDSRRRSRAGALELWDIADNSTHISKIIAVSGVATDRFPSRLTLRRRPQSQAAYRYIGPRTDNNLVSRAQGIAQIAASLLESPDRIRFRYKHLKHAFSILKVANGIHFTFTRSVAEEGKWTLPKIKNRLINIKHDSQDSEERVQLVSRCVQIMKANYEVEIRLDLDDVVRIDATHGDLKAIEALLNCNLIAVKDSYTYNDTDSKVLRLNDFSSGQWHIFSSLLFTAIAVEDNTLILIDEPENSLHPEWQQQYLRLMKNVISSSSGVHLVIATHSPLIASSLDPVEAEVIRLKRNQRGRLTADALEAGPFGWTSDEILQDVFGLDSSRSIEFTKRMDAALGLFAKGDRTNPKLHQLVKSLQKTLPNLPSDDIARQIINTLLIVLDNSELK